MTADGRRRRQCIRAAGIASMQSFFRRFFPPHAEIEGACRNAPAVLNLAPAMRRMNPVLFGGRKTGGFRDRPRICHREKRDRANCQTETAPGFCHRADTLDPIWDYMPGKRAGCA